MSTVTPRDLSTQFTRLTNKNSLIEVYDPDTDENVKMEYDDLLINTPQTFDISSSNQGVNLPSASGASVSRLYRWTGGTGSFVFTTTAAGSDTISGLSSSTWVGEGEGVIKLTSDGVSDWVVEVYCDKGSNANGSYTKHLNGDLEEWCSGDKNNGIIDPQTFNYPKAFNTIEISIAQQDSASFGSTATTASVKNVNTYDIVIYSRAGVQINSSREFTLYAKGTWR